ncbi:MAG: DUF4920 domain-containing protein [Rhodothermia bacterium]|nr:DUF4920 domain-containing protein [Rhodothermia bacterium]
MRQFLILGLMLGLAACSGSAIQNADGSKKITAPSGYEHIGLVPVKLRGAITVAQGLADAQSKPGKSVVVKGEVEKVCQAKGCWMTLKRADGESIRVTFKDYAFFMPKDIAGRQIVASGIFEKKEESVEHLRHLAEDEGKPQSEIDAITQPKTSWGFLADGVLLKK